MPSSLWLMQKRSSLNRLCTPCCTAPYISRLQEAVHKPTLGDAAHYACTGVQCVLACRWIDACMQFDKALAGMHSGIALTVRCSLRLWGPLHSS